MVRYHKKDFYYYFIPRRAAFEGRKDLFQGFFLEQVKAKGYADKFKGQETYLIGVEFSSKERNIVRFEWERAGSGQKEKRGVIRK